MADFVLHFIVPVVLVLLIVTLLFCLFTHGEDRVIVFQLEQAYNPKLKEHTNQAMEHHKEFTREDLYFTDVSPNRLPEEHVPSYMNSRQDLAWKRKLARL